MTHRTEAHPDPLPPELFRLAERINAEHTACEAALRSRVVHAIETGRLLLEVKARLGRGQWPDWVRAHCHFPEREARGYVRIARLSGEREAADPQRFADLGLRDALSLLAEAQALPPAVSPEGARLAELEAVLDGVGRRLIEVGRAALEVKRK